MLPPDVKAVMTALPDNLQQLATALMKINDNFHGQNAYLFSQTLARASSGPSLADTVKSLAIPALCKKHDQYPTNNDECCQSVKTQGKTFGRVLNVPQHIWGYKTAQVAH